MRVRQTDPRVGRPSFCFLPVLVFCLLVPQSGCMGPMLSQRPSAFVEPPRERLQAELANDRIKVSDVLQFTLNDGTSVNLSGTYKVGPDGDVELSGYGKIQVAGKTMEEAKQAIREVLAAKALVQAAFELGHSEYYLVTVTAEGVQDLTRVPLAGKVTVRDAVKGIPRLSNKVLWITRPAPGESVKEQVLAIDWEGVSRLDDNRTNYVLQAGDWLFVADEPAHGFGRFFGALTSMLSSRKGDSPEPPRPTAKPSTTEFHIHDVDNPKGERI